MSSDKLSQGLKNDLSSLVYIDPKGLRPRHRVIASIIINNIIKKHELFNLTRDLAIALSPYVTLNTITQRTLHYRIARSLLDEEFICNFFGTRRARDLYEDLEKEYGWNARFWEQRALIEARNLNFPRARSYAEEALRIQKHPFTFNTLGSILTQMAIEYFEPGTPESGKSFWEGIKYLRESRKSEYGRIHPYITFFTRALAYSRKLKRIGSEDTKLSNEWQHWIDDAKNAQVFHHQENYVKLQDYHIQWINLAISTPWAE